MTHDQGSAPAPPAAAGPTRTSEAPLPPLVKQLGWVSFFTDASTEMLYPLVPLFLTATLGAPVALVGLIEGIADGVATGLKAVAGYIADRVHRNRAMVAFGYTLSSLAKPLLAFAPGWGVVLALRLSDRFGKAIRGVPRDLMIADAVTPAQRGRAFGLHRAMDTAGAVVGPLLALGLLAFFSEDNLRPVFLFAFAPGLATILLLSRLPRNDHAPGAPEWSPQPLPWRSRFGRYSAVLLLFGLGNSSDAFLILRARDLGLSASGVILAYALFNLVNAAFSIPAGRWADQLGRLRVFRWGLFVFAAVYLGFAVAPSKVWVWPLFAVYGLYMAFTDGVGRAVVLDMVPASVKGKALGVTQAVSGGAVLIAGLSAGILWEVIGPAAPFVVGAATALGAWLLLAIVSHTPDHDVATA